MLQLGNLAADLIELRLRLVQGLGGGSVLVPQRFHLPLNAAQDRHGLFHPVFLPPHLLGFRLRLAREVLPVQGQEFRLELALFPLELLIPLRRPGLPLQMLQLPAQLVSQIRHPGHVVPRAPDAPFGFPAALPEFGYAGGLFQEGPQFFGLGLYQPRDHPLLDDGVAAGPQARA